jgi:hypothetical protein
MVGEDPESFEEQDTNFYSLHDNYNWTKCPNYFPDGRCRKRLSESKPKCIFISRDDYRACYLFSDYLSNSELQKAIENVSEIPSVREGSEQIVPGYN